MANAILVVLLIVGVFAGKIELNPQHVEHEEGEQHTDKKISSRLVREANDKPDGVEEHKGTYGVEPVLGGRLDNSDAGSADKAPAADAAPHDAPHAAKVEADKKD